MSKPTTFHKFTELPTEFQVYVFSFVPALASEMNPVLCHRMLDNLNFLFPAYLLPRKYLPYHVPFFRELRPPYPAYIPYRTQAKFEFYTKGRRLVRKRMALLFTCRLCRELMLKKIAKELVAIDLDYRAWSQLNDNAETGRGQLMENQAHVIELLINLIVATQNEKAIAIVEKSRFEGGFAENWFLEVKGKNEKMVNKRMHEWDDWWPQKLQTNEFYWTHDEDGSLWFEKKKKILYEAAKAFKIEEDKEVEEAGVKNLKTDRKSFQEEIPKGARAMVGADAKARVPFTTMKLGWKRKLILLQRRSTVWVESLGR